LSRTKKQQALDQIPELARGWIAGFHFAAEPDHRPTHTHCTNGHQNNEFELNAIDVPAMIDNVLEWVDWLFWHCRTSPDAKQLAFVPGCRSLPGKD